MVSQIAGLFSDYIVCCATPRCQCPFPTRWGSMICHKRVTNSAYKCVTN